MTKVAHFGGVNMNGLVTIQHEILKDVSRSVRRFMFFFCCIFWGKIQIDSNKSIFVIIERLSC